MLISLPIAMLLAFGSGLGTWLDFVLVDCMQHDLVWLLLCVLLKTLTPVVAEGVCEDVTLSIEGGCSNGSTCAREALCRELSVNGKYTRRHGRLTQTMLGLAIPKVELTI